MTKGPDTRRQAPQNATEAAARAVLALERIAAELARIRDALGAAGTAGSQATVADLLRALLHGR